MTVFCQVLLSTVCEVRLGSLPSCFKEFKCPNSQTCCGNVCVASQVCKIECQEQADCDKLVDNHGCVAGFCECPPSSPCINISTIRDNESSPSCATDFNCTKLAKCRNWTCVTNDGHSKESPLNPALLAIVTIIGVLVFSCLFCCCLSRMKSERHSMKTRVAKGKLKRVHHLGEDADSAAKSALVGVEGQASPVKDGKDTKELDAEDEALISIVTGGPALAPIREEDEGDDEAEKA